MDPAHTPRSCFKHLEEALKQHEAVMASLASEEKKSEVTQELNFSSLLSQVQQLTTALAQLAPVNPFESTRILVTLPKTNLWTTH